MIDIKVEYVPIDLLQPNPRNARKHPKKQLHELASSIAHFQFVNPLIVDKNYTVLAGAGRLQAGKIAGLTTLPVVRVDHLTEEQKRAFALADNKIASNSEWDMELLAREFKELSALDLDFDLEVTGFGTAEIDVLIDGKVETIKSDPADVVPEIQASAVSELGYVWLLGEHRLLCGDARHSSSFAELLDSEKARVAFADLPYNVRIQGHVSGLGKVMHREFAMASGEMVPAEFKSFLQTSCANMAAASLDGAIHFLCMDWRHIGELMGAANEVYSEFKNLCVWNKNNGGMGSFYRSKHELVFVYKVGTAPHINTIELGKNGRYRTNVWDYAGVNTWRAGRDAELEMHPTVKPTALVIDAIKDCSRHGDIVLDPFCGSGTTIIAAHKCRRRARAIEIDPLYVDVAVRRWQAFTGQEATLAGTGETFAEIEGRGDPLG